MSKLESISKFAKEHPFITVIGALIVDGWVSGIIDAVGRKKKSEVIDVDFEEHKGENE